MMMNKKMPYAKKKIQHSYNFKMLSCCGNTTIQKMKWQSISHHVVLLSMMLVMILSNTIIKMLNVSIFFVVTNLLLVCSGRRFCAFFSVTCQLCTPIVILYLPPDYLRGYWPGLFGASLISRPPVTIIFCAPGRSAEYCQKHLVPSTFQEAAGAPGLV